MNSAASIHVSRPRPRAFSAASLLGFHVVLASMLAAFVFALALRPMADPDIFWHLRNAESLVRTHRWIQHDTYAYTTFGMPWIDHEWLAELPLYFSWRLWGVHGLLAATIILLEGIFFGVFYLGCLYCANVKAAWATTLTAVLLATVSFGPRTLLFGWLLLVAELILLARFENARAAGAASSRALWLLPPLFVLWVNAHGSWLIGLIVLLVYFGCGLFPWQADALEARRWEPHERRFLSRLILLCTAALFVNPYGWRLAAYPFDLAFRQRLNIARVQEWQQLDLHSVRGRLLLLVVMLLLISSLLRRQTWAPYQLAFFWIGIYAALSYSRFSFLAGILSLPLLARAAPRVPNSLRIHPRKALHSALLCLVCAVGVRVYRLRTSAVTAMDNYPAQALPFLNRWQPQGRVFNDYLWGGYLEQQTPQIPVFIDSRVDIFERRGVFADYLDAIDLKNSLEVLDKYRIRYVLFEKNTPLAYMLRQSPAWAVEYEDATTILFQRSFPPNTSSARAHAPV